MHCPSPQNRDFKNIHKFFNEGNVNMAGLRPNQGLCGGNSKAALCAGSANVVVVYIQPVRRSVCFVCFVCCLRARWFTLSAVVVCAADVRTQVSRSPSVTLNLPSGRWSGRCFDPVTGKFTSSFSATGRHGVSCPSSVADAVVLLKA